MIATQHKRWQHQGVNWSVLAPAIFSLLGVAVGAAGSLFGSYLSTRTSKEQARQQLLASLRLERKDVIMDYLNAAEEMQAFIRSIWYRRDSLTTDPEVAREASNRNRQMWFYQQKIHMVATDELRRACLAFTEKLEECIGYTDEPGPEIPEGTNFWLYIDREKDKFLDQARDELGFRALSTEALPKQ